jgi:hypothetical protein
MTEGVILTLNLNVLGEFVPVPTTNAVKGWVAILLTIAIFALLLCAGYAAVVGTRPPQNVIELLVLISGILVLAVRALWIYVRTRKKTQPE